MVQVNVQADCGNAPKKAFLRDFLVAFAEGNKSEFLIDSVSEDIEWEIVGEARIIGKTAFANTVKRPSPNKTVELTLEHIITHGKEASVTGHFLFEDGERYAFSDVYVFTSAKGNQLKLIKSFNIKLG